MFTNTSVSKRSRNFANRHDKRNAQSRHAQPCDTNNEQHHTCACDTCTPLVVDISALASGLVAEKNARAVAEKNTRAVAVAMVCVDVVVVAMACVGVVESGNVVAPMG